MRSQLRVIASQRRRYHCIQLLQQLHHPPKLLIPSSTSSHQRLLSSAQPQDRDEAATAAANAAIAKDGLPSTAFVGREDQKVEEQKRRRLSDVRVLSYVCVCMYDKDGHSSHSLCR